MLKKELLDTFRSTRAKIVFFVFLAIMVYDFVDKIYWQYQDYWFHPEAYPDGLAEVKHFSIAGFLNGGISSNNPQYLILWLLPIWCLLLCGDSPIREEKCGYLPLIETRISRKKYFWKKNQGVWIFADGSAADNQLSALYSRIYKWRLLYESGRLRGSRSDSVV